MKEPSVGCVKQTHSNNLGKDLWLPHVFHTITHITCAHTHTHTRRTLTSLVLNSWAVKTLLNRNCINWLFPTFHSTSLSLAPLINTDHSECATSQKIKVFHDMYYCGFICLHTSSVYVFMSAYILESQRLPVWFLEYVSILSLIWRVHLFDWCK